MNSSCISRYWEWFSSIPVFLQPEYKQMFNTNTDGLNQDILDKIAKFKSSDPILNWKLQHLIPYILTLRNYFQRYRRRVNHFLIKMVILCFVLKFKYWFIIIGNCFVAHCSVVHYRELIFRIPTTGTIISEMMVLVLKAEE